MSYTADQLLSLAGNFDKTTAEALIKSSKKKKKFPFWLMKKKDTNSAKDKSSKKLDPKAEVRNRGDVVFPAESSNVKNNADHFPINNIDQARNALAQVHKYDKAPEWYKGSLQSLINAVVRNVKSKYPSIEVSKDTKKKSDYYDDLLKKFGQATNWQYYDNNVGDWIPASNEKISILPTRSVIRDYQNENDIRYQVRTNGGWKLSNPQGEDLSQNDASETAKTISTPEKSPVQTRQLLPVRDDVKTAQNILYRAHQDFAKAIQQSGGVDGKLGPATIKALKEYLPRMNAEEAVAYLNAEAKKQTEEVNKPEVANKPTTTTSGSTWGNAPTPAPISGAPMTSKP